MIVLAALMNTVAIATFVASGTALPSTEPFAPEPPAGLDPTTVTPGVLGFTVTLLLGIATVLLILSMIKHLNKIPREPDTRIPPGPPRTPGNRDSRPPAH
jgi:hypothetical protein